MYRSFSDILFASRKQFLPIRPPMPIVTFRVRTHIPSFHRKSHRTLWACQIAPTCWFLLSTFRLYHILTTFNVDAF